MYIFSYIFFIYILKKYKQHYSISSTKQALNIYNTSKIQKNNFNLVYQKKTQKRPNKIKHYPSSQCLNFVTLQIRTKPLLWPIPKHQYLNYISIAGKLSGFLYAGIKMPIIIFIFIFFERERKPINLNDNISLKKKKKT